MFICVVCLSWIWESKLCLFCCAHWLESMRRYWRLGWLGLKLEMKNCGVKKQQPVYIHLSQVNMKNDVKHKHTFGLNTIRLERALVKLLQHTKQKNGDSDYICTLHKAKQPYINTNNKWIARNLEYGAIKIISCLNISKASISRA